MAAPSLPPGSAHATVVLADGRALALQIDHDGAVRAIAETEPPAAAAPGVQTLGLVDLQANGFAGIDFNDPRLDTAQLDHALAAMARTGVGICLPTLITAPIERLERCFRALEAACAGSSLARSMVPGYHLEGPFLSPLDGYCGCHPRAAMRTADIGVFDRLNAAAGGRIRLLTVAPEVEGALELIRHARARGIAVALGHTAADRATVAAAAEAGATLSTHLGNGTPKVLPRNDNPVMAQLAEDRLHASFIADGIHIPAGTLRVYMRAKELRRCVLVTDATAAAGAAPGDYTLGPVAIRRMPDGSVRDGTTPGLAGSALTLDHAVANVAAWLGLNLPQAAGMAREAPLGLLGMDGTPTVGQAAAIVRWRKEAAGWCVIETRLGGRLFPAG
ncbi:MAG: N-acetylglucosamine-6-phosphate deacetylase [Alphaproteobacteria bacterium]|nr:N-acetylglucosamine-6-phosphate deacetylase [Alphaproteobacteria bacterium]